MTYFKKITAVLFLVSLLFLHKSIAFDALSKLLNANQKTGIDEYKAALGTKVTGDANNGIQGYYDRLLESNKCIRDLARGFYREIIESSGNVFSVSSERNILTPPNKTTQGHFWKTALDWANNDKNLAMVLMGICGHDDVAYSQQLFCPQPESGVYDNESLGKGYDISNELKMRVVKAQGDNGKADHIPNKYYHVIGAATTSCLMLRRGVPPALARTAAMAVVNGYRSGRLCNDILTEGHSVSLFKYADRAKMNDVILNGKYSKYYDDVMLLVRRGKDDEIKLKKLKVELSHLDALYVLYQQKDILKECTKDGMSGGITQFLKGKKHRQGKFCPPDFTGDRCERLLHRLDTWELDREWTEAQHMVGFDFAQKNCEATIKTGKEIEEAACKALKKQNVLPVNYDSEAEVKPEAEMIK